MKRNETELKPMRVCVCAYREIMADRTDRVFDGREGTKARNTLCFRKNAESRPEMPKNQSVTVSYNPVNFADNNPAGKNV
ncbi:MAG: hypothetical protein J6C42_10380, partial [Clostridia bacterium]|nr:hypothetical protein [Clostridia bacterium]